MSSLEPTGRRAPASGTDIDWETCLDHVEDFISSCPPSDVPVELVQRVLQVGVRTYYQKRDAGDIFGPFIDEGVVSATEGIVAAANILEAVDVDVFEFGMFKTIAEG